MIRHLVWGLRMWFAVTAVYVLAARHTLSQGEHTRQLT